MKTFTFVPPDPRKLGLTPRNRLTEALGAARTRPRREGKRAAGSAGPEVGKRKWDGAKALGPGWRRWIGLGSRGLEFEWETVPAGELDSLLR